MRQQPRPIFGSLYVLLLVSAAAGSAAAGSIIGTAIYRERVLLPPEAVFEAGIEEVSRADGPSGVIATTRIGSPQVPLAFTLGHDDARISNDRRYVIRARITLNGNIFFTTDTAYPVLGIAGGNHVDILLRRTGDTSAAPLENTYWKLTVLRGASVETVDPQHEAHLILDPKEQRVSGSSGCNRLIGAYTLTGDRLSFGQMA